MYFNNRAFLLFINTLTNFHSFTNHQVILQKEILKNGSLVTERRFNGGQTTLGLKVILKKDMKKNGLLAKGHKLSNTKTTCYQRVILKDVLNRNGPQERGP